MPVTPATAAPTVAASAEICGRRWERIQAGHRSCRAAVAAGKVSARRSGTAAALFSSMVMVLPPWWFRLRSARNRLLSGPIYRWRRDGPARRAPVGTAGIRTNMVVTLAHLITHCRQLIAISSIRRRPASSPGRCPGEPRPPAGKDRGFAGAPRCGGGLPHAAPVLRGVLRVRPHRCYGAGCRWGAGGSLVPRTLTLNPRANAS